MKKTLTLIIAAVLALTMAACDKKKEESQSPVEAVPDTKSEGVMSYDEFAAADFDTEVIIETYVQAKQEWKNDRATVYTQDGDGAYYLYDMICSKEDYERLIPGQKIKVTGLKSEWSGETEIVDAAFEIEKGSYIAPAEDVTGLLGKEEELYAMQNRFVSFRGMNVEPIEDPERGVTAFLYNWDGSGSAGDDLFFNVSKDGKVYNFEVKSALCDETTDVYKAVENLKVGDKVDLEGFLYWYEGPNPHITSVKVK